MVLHVAQSEISTPDRLRCAVDALAGRFAKKSPNRYVGTGRKFLWTMVTDDEETDEFDDSTDFHARTLPDLADFDVRKPAVGAELELDMESRKVADADHWLRWIVEHRTDLHGASLFLYADRSSHDSSPGGAESDFVEDSNVRFLVQADRQGDLRLSWGIQGAESIQPAVCRRFLQTCVEAIGLADSVRFEDSPKGFRVLSDALRIHVGIAKHGGYDPSGIGISVSSPDILLDWYRRSLVETGVRPTGMAVHLKCDLRPYREFRETWNAMSSGWEVQFEGAYRPEVDPFAIAAVGSASALTFPLLEWEAGGVDFYYQCDLVLTSDGGRLEMLTNVRSPKNMMERLKKSDCGLSFRLL